MELLGVVEDAVADVGLAVIAVFVADANGTAPGLHVGTERGESGSSSRVFLVSRLKVSRKLPGTEFVLLLRIEGVPGESKDAIDVPSRYAGLGSSTGVRLRNAWD